jgi:hypothetical protein
MRSRIILRVATVAVALAATTLCSAPVTAQVTWDAGGGADKSWGNAANWSGNVTPGSSDLVVFNNTGASNLPGSPTSVLDMARTIGGLSIANTGNNFQTIDLGTNALQINGNVDVNTNVLDSTQATIKHGTLNLGSSVAPIDLSVGRLVQQNDNNDIATLDLTGATTNAYLGTLTVGEKTLGGRGFAMGTLSFGATGAVSVGSAGSLGKIVIGHTATGGSSTGVVDLSQQASFSANVSSLLLGTAEVGGASGTLSLAASNTINAGTVRVGFSTQNDNGTSALHLGLSNTVSANEFTVAGRLSNATLDMPNGGTLNLGTVAAPTNLTVGETDAGTATSFQGTMQLANGTFNATLSSLAVGVKTGGGSGSQTGSETATLVGGSSGNIVVGSPAAPGTITVAQVANGGGAFGTVDLSGENSLTANLSSLLIGTAASGTATGTMSLPVNNTITATTIRVGFSTAGDTQTGPNSLHLGMNNTVNAGELTVGGQQSNASLDMHNGAILNLGLSGTPTALHVGETNAATGSNFQGSLQLSGGTFNANLSSLSVGVRSGGGSGTQTGSETGTLTGGNAGTITIGTPNSPGTIAVGQVAGGGGATGTVDLSSENNLTANVSTLLVGSASGGTAIGNLSLPVVNNITANTVRVGYSTVNDTQSAPSTLHLGTSNVINAGEFTIGGQRSTGSLDIQVGGTLSLGTANAPTNLIVGETNAQTNQSESGSMNLGGATFNATLSSLAVGVKTGGGSATETGTLTGGNAGSMVVGAPGTLGTVTIGQSQGGGSASGTVDLSGQNSFNATLSQAIVGQNGSGTWKLPTNNTIDTQTLIVGDNGTGNLAFGAHNSLLADTMQVGNSYSNASVTIPAGGSISIGSDARPTNLAIGKVLINTNSNYTSTVDLSNSHVDAWLSSLTVGSRDTSLPGGEIVRFYGGNSGTINIGATGHTANMIVGAGTNSGADFSQMDTFNANLNQMTLGANGSATMALAKSTTIDASSMVVGTGTGVVGTATLTLGQNNNLLVDNVQVGINYGNGSIQLPAGGTLNLGQPGRPTTLVLGAGVTNTNSIYAGTMDLSAGTVHAYLGNVTMGQKDGQPGGQNGTLSISSSANNTIVANSILLGTGNATGTINFGGGDFTAASIAKGVGGSAAFNWQGGTLHVGTFGTPSIHLDMANTGTGTLAPANSAGTAPGTTQIFGNYTQQSSATMQIDLGGAQPGTGYDQVTISNTANLGGTLAVHLINGFQPTLNEIFTPLSFGAHVGNFSSFTGLDVGNHLTLEPLIMATGLELIARPTLNGDINLDGIVNAQDLAAVSSNWLSNSPQGDVNADGIVNAQDLAVISSNWLATDPSAGSSAVQLSAVPEPATYALLSVGALIMLGTRLRRRAGR